MPRLGILGFANTGKTTVFNALTGLSAVTAPHPFATIEPNLGVGRIHDHRLEQAAAIERSAKLVPATLDLIDLPALGHDGKGGAAGQYLAPMSPHKNRASIRLPRPRLSPSSSRWPISMSSIVVANALPRRPPPIPA
jgi:hypothetical protein